MNQDDREYIATVRAASEWISRIESGELKDLHTFAEWLSENAARQSTARGLMQVTCALRSLTPVEWADVSAAVENRPINVLPLRAPRQRSLGERAPYSPAPQRLRGVAAALVVTLVAGLLVKSLGAWPTHYSAGVGQRIFAPLEDGSTAELNTRTRLEVNYALHSREITLVSGEATFDVRHDSERPFRIKVGGIVIQDVGTKFDVYRHPDGTVTITVVEGSVDVSTATGGERIEAGQVATVHVHGQRMSFQVESVSSQEIDRRLSWQTGWLRFDGETVAQGIQDVNRYNLRQLVLDDPELAGKQLGGQVRAVDLDSFVQSLELTLGVRAQSSPHDPNTIHLKRGPGSP